MSEPVITVVRLPYPAQTNPPRQLVSLVGRVDLDLAEALHACNNQPPRAYATAVNARQCTLDVVCFDDALPQALLMAEPAARLVTRVRPRAWLTVPADERLHLTFLAPTHFRIRERDHLLPDSDHLFGSLLRRWAALDWPALPVATVPALPARLLGYRLVSVRVKQETLSAFVGTVEYDLGVRSLRDASRQAIWALARFAEWRGVGAHTSYGLGRVRLVQPGDQAATLGHVWERAA